MFKKITPFLAILFLIVPAYFSLLRPGYFSMQDDLQAFRVFEMNKCFSDFQIPCRWVPDAGYQYGYPQFNFYPPLPYYLGSVLHLAGFQYIDVVKILFVVGYILSAFAIYVLISSLLKDKWAGFVSAILYTYVPYKAVEVYVRGALSEFWAQIFFPLVLWAIYRLIKSGKIKYLVWMSVSIFFLMTTHVLMTIIFIPVAIVWAGYWLIRNKWKNFGKIGWGGLLGFGLSAFFVLPVVFERQFVHTEGLLSGYFDYRQHFVNLYKLFISREWGYGSSGFPNEKLNLSLGIPQWIFALVFVPVVSLLRYKKNKQLAILALVTLVGSLFTIFMIHMKSSFIWSLLPFLQYMQFPWRFLAVAILLLCLLVGIGLNLSGKYKHLLGILLIGISFMLTINYFVPKDWLNITDQEKFTGTNWEKQLTISIFDYLPIYATLPPWQKAPELPEVLNGKADFLSYQKGSDYQYGEVVVNEYSTLRLPLFDFPGMLVKVDGKPTAHINNDCDGQRYCLGLVTFDVSPGTHRIEARLTDTPVRRVGNIITLMSLVIVGFYIFRLKAK